MAIKEEKGWRTCDLKVIAFLLYMKFPVVEYGRNESRVFFEFDDNQARKDAVLSFWNKTEKVEPVAFLDSLNRARDMVTQAMNS